MKNKIIIFIAVLSFSLNLGLDPSLKGISKVYPLGLAEEQEGAEDISPPSETEASQKISMDIKGMDILDVLKMLAMRADLNIIAGRNVTGKVTIFLKDADVMDALEITLAANDLAYEQRGNIINVMTARDYEMIYGEKYRDRRELVSIPLKFGKASSLAAALNQVKSNIGKVIADDASSLLVVLDVPEKIAQIQEMVKNMDRPLESRVFDLNYALPDKLLTQLQEAVTKGVGIVKMDERNNKVVIVDYPEKLVEIEKVILAFDEATRQVLIEAKIIQVTLSDDFQMGIDWETMFEKEFDIKGMFNVATTTGGRITLGTTTVTNEADFKTIINILKSVGDTKVLSNPRITAINGQEAKILVGSKKAYSTSTVVQGQTTTETAENITFLDVGVKLFVTPKINKQGFVTMKIRPEVSSVTSTYTTPRGNVIPIIETSEAETSVMVKDGVTIIIGGLIKDEKTKSVNKIPFLGDIPILGLAFRNTTDTIRRTELVIFLTPHLLSGSSSYLDYATKSQDKDVIKIKSNFEEQAKLVEEKTQPINSLEEILYTPQEYYGMIREKVMQLVRLNLPERDTKGRIEVSFDILEDGRLQGLPQIIESENKNLDSIVIKAVEGAAPYPPFPRGVDKESLTFRLSLFYE